MTTSASTTSPTDVRRLTTPAALALADLVGIFENLQAVLKCCERLMTELAPETGEPDDLTLEALWTTAVMAYARCFTPGSRGAGLTADDVTATGLAGDVLGWHRILEQLQKHFADPATTPRDFTVGASRDETGAANGVAVTSAQQPLVDELSVRQTGAVAFELSRLVDARIGEQQAVVFAALRAMSPADLDKLPVLEVTAPGAATDGGSVAP